MESGDVVSTLKKKFAPQRVVQPGTREYSDAGMSSLAYCGSSAITGNKAHQLSCFKTVYLDNYTDDRCQCSSAI